jgi:hypothetical protein
VFLEKRGKEYLTIKKKKGKNKTSTHKREKEDN